MKRLMFLALLLHTLCHAQQDSIALAAKATEREARLSKRTIIFKLEVAAPIVGNPHWNEYDTDIGSDDEDPDPWFLPTGLNIKTGAGMRIARFFILGAAGGIESRLDHKLVVAPLFGDLTVRIPAKDNNQFLAHVGVGRVFALGRDGLSGDYRRVGIGFGNYSSAGILDLSQYGLNYKGKTAITNFSVGLEIRF